MRRRDFIYIVPGATCWSFAARAQPSSVPTIGFLGSDSHVSAEPLLRAFHDGLSESGFNESQNVAIEYRWAEGRNDRLPSLVADLIRRGVSVIAAPVTTPGALAAKAATATIPIVIFTAGDPVTLGLVASLNRPGGNVTGTTSLAGELAPKRLELMRDLLPTASQIALLVNPTNLTLMTATVRAAQAAAKTLSVELAVVEAASESEIESAFKRIVEMRVDGLVSAVDSFFTSRRIQIAQLSIHHRVPAIYQSRDFAAAGGVMSYGGSLADGFRLVGVYTGRILKGEEPSELPIQQVTKIELIINTKAAKSLGLLVPTSLLARADEVIE